MNRSIRENHGWFTFLLFCQFFLFSISIGFTREIDIPFSQEIHEAYPIPGNDDDNDVRTVFVDQHNRVWAGTKNGLYRFQDETWQPVSGINPGPVYQVYNDPENTIWVGAWDGLYQISQDQISKIPTIHDPIRVLCHVPGGMIAIGPNGSFRLQQGTWSELHESWSLNARDAVLDHQGELWYATGLGLYRWNEKILDYYYKDKNLSFSEINSLAIASDGGLWIGELGGIDVYENNRLIQRYSGKNGLPDYDIRSLTFASDGVLWIGSGHGVIRYDGKSWSVRHSRRWLLSDDVRDIAIAADQTAWIATAKGVSAIKKKTMTLSEKADFFESILEKRHIRPPGYVEKCYFPDPSDRSRFDPWDDDNDGQYTNIYMAMESLRYAVTNDPQARDRANQAYEALEMLQTITETPHFVARTIIPSDWKRMADANETISPQEAAERRIDDPRYKPVETRWRPSADGKWLWKGDTSSDEITGHFFGYYFYYRFAADTIYQERVRQLVRRIMDGIIENGYVLRDIDGQPTRWGVWSPEKLNHDPDWRVEKPINSFEILSYLKTAYFITGDEKYQNEYKKLIDVHGYLENCRQPKTYERSDRSHIDDELLALAAPGLVLNEADPQLRQRYLDGLTWAYRTVEKECDPFYNFIFGMIGGQNFHLEESLAFLRDHPLDLIQWTVDNSWREDVQLVRFPMVEPLQIDRMLPASERGVMRWDKNPWEASAGDIHDGEGHFESCGVFWLFPYWLGRYCGYIE